MKRRKMPEPQDENFILSDGSMEHGDYNAEDYADFISNGMTNNEKIDALEYYETFLSPQNGDEG
ncbi:MAG: hypothetical protein IJU51_05500 [Clostridia bacterium]|nr:hypothetical protein [Clostridia bacterium]